MASDERREALERVADAAPEALRQCHDVLGLLAERGPSPDGSRLRFEADLGIAQNALHRLGAALDRLDALGREPGGGEAPDPGGWSGQLRAAIDGAEAARKEFDVVETCECCGLVYSEDHIRYSSGEAPVWFCLWCYDGLIEERFTQAGGEADRAE